MSKRQSCRNCGAKLKHDKTSDQYDPEYCSGLCRKKDGSEPYVKTAAEQAMVVKEAKLTLPATYKDYMKNVGGRYVRRFEPEKLNWGEPMSDNDLLQAGFRANREPIEGDWDYQEKEPLPQGEGLAPTDQDRKDAEDASGMGYVCDYGEDPSWNEIRAKAKGLGIKTHGKKREEIEAEIKEVENAG